MLQTVLRGVFVRRLSCVLVSTSPPMCGAAAVVIGALRRVPMKYWVMDLNPDQMIALGRIKATSLPARIFNRLNRAVLARADHVVALEDAVVVEFMFVNPHARLRFTWVDAEGAEGEWEGELSGSNELVRSRIYPDLVAPGDRITVKGYPHESVPRNMRLSSVVLPDGREVPLP